MHEKSGNRVRAYQDSRCPISRHQELMQPNRLVLRPPTGLLERQSRKNTSLSAGIFGSQPYGATCSVARVCDPEEPQNSPSLLLTENAYPVQGNVDEACPIRLGY
jgi:hypothetical protein